MCVRTNQAVVTNHGLVEREGGFYGGGLAPRLLKTGISSYRDDLPCFFFIYLPDVDVLMGLRRAHLSFHHGVTPPSLGVLLVILGLYQDHAVGCGRRPVQIILGPTHPRACFRDSLMALSTFSCQEQRLAELHYRSRGLRWNPESLSQRRFRTAFWHISDPSRPYAGHQS